MLQEAGPFSLQVHKSKQINFLSDMSSVSSLPIYDFAKNRGVSLSRESKLFSVQLREERPIFVEGEPN